MEETKWAQWLRSLTHEDTERGIARVVGRSHTTVQRWASKGVPVQTVWELTVRFKGDPIAALVLLDRVKPEQVQLLNFAAMLRYADADLLTAELHSRAMRERAKAIRSDAFDGVPFRDDQNSSLGRSDSLERRGFRLTAKM